jgi:hypothetical protein
MPNAQDCAGATVDVIQREAVEKPHRLHHALTTRAAIELAPVLPMRCGMNRQRIVEVLRVVASQVKPRVEHPNPGGSFA